MPRRKHLDNTTPNSYNSYINALKRKWQTEDIGEDTYDYRSLLKNDPRTAYNVLYDKNGAHFPDTYKFPTHPTFSTESKYSNGSTPGGTWIQNNNGTWVFHHSPYTARHLDITDDYLGNNYYVSGVPELSYYNGSYRLPTITITARRKRTLRNGGRIYIKPENRGKFTETMRRTGKTAEELSHSSNPLTRKRAIFALNARKWKH